MATEVLTTEKRSSKNGAVQRQKDRYRGNKHSGNWPLDYESAFNRYPGPYTAENAWALLEEEPLELFNGWLVWQPMTNLEERRVAGVIQVILDMAARFANFGQAFPDQAECQMSDDTVQKPDVCVISNKRFEEKVQPVVEGHEHLVLKGSPELVVEIRSPSNRRTKEKNKRKTYFENGAEVIWDVDAKRHKLWVYEVENPTKAVEYTEQDEITCERLLPGWRRPVCDLFAKNLTAEDIAGQAAVQWREESEAKGREEGELEALRNVLLRQARRRYGDSALPADLSSRLEKYNAEQLNELADSIVTSPTLADWLAIFSK